MGITWNVWSIRATSYGAIGENYILASGFGAKMAGGSWINTGEGGVIPEHLHTGANIVAQIGPGLFGCTVMRMAIFQWRNLWRKRKKVISRHSELKFGQGAKIRGGHLEGQKVNEKIASVRNVREGETINSPNRFSFLNNAVDTLSFIQQLQESVW